MVKKYRELTFRRSATVTDRYLAEALDSFLNDPPDTDFQRGYLAAICNVAEALTDDLAIASKVIRCRALRKAN